MSAAVRGLKDLSGELGIPVLALVQLNPNRATRADKRPQLADLRESGDLENTADSVLGLYREEMDHPGSRCSCRRAAAVAHCIFRWAVGVTTSSGAGRWARVIRAATRA